MSKVGVSLKLDVTKMDKARFFKGNKGTYCDCTVFVDLDELDQYGNSGMITQDVTKEDRDAGGQGPILGNAKVFWKSDDVAPQPQARQQKAPDPDDDMDQEIPF